MREGGGRIEGWHFSLAPTGAMFRGMQTVLITGFEPFDGDIVNPSMEAIRVLASHRPEGVRLAVAPLPVSARRIEAALREALEAHRPDVVIAVGQAGGRVEMSVERVAINVDDFRIPDNAGDQPVDEPVVAGGPAAYFSTLPIKAMVRRMREVGVPANVSQTAGTFLCNHVFYSGPAFCGDGVSRDAGRVHSCAGAAGAGSAQSGPEQHGAGDDRDRVEGSD